MIPRLEIGIDCIDPVRLAPFWAAALGYSVGDLDSAETYLDLVPPVPSSGGDDTVTAGPLASAVPSLPAVYLQRVPEEKHVKNRLHLDLMVVDPQSLVRQLQDLGATSIGEPRSGSEGGWWQVMADPEGNEFCVCEEYLDDVEPPGPEDDEVAGPDRGKRPG